MKMIYMQRIFCSDDMKQHIAGHINEHLADNQRYGLPQCANVIYIVIQRQISGKQQCIHDSKHLYQVEIAQDNGIYSNICALLFCL